MNSKSLNFNKLYSQFTKSTKENFPAGTCTKQNKYETNVFDSKIPYLCLVIDRRFDDRWEIIVLYPYICKESDTVTTFGWTDRSGNVYCNIENSTQLLNEFVVGFKEYANSNSYKSLWNKFIEEIDNQYDN